MNFYLFFFRIRQNGHFFVNKTLELNPSLTPSVKFTIKMNKFILYFSHLIVPLTLCVEGTSIEYGNFCVNL